MADANYQRITTDEMDMNNIMNLADKRALRRSWLLVILLVIFTGRMVSAAIENSPTDMQTQQKASLVKVTHGLPLAFEENKGQVNPDIKYFAKGASYDVLFTDKGPNIVIVKNDNKKDNVIAMRLIGVNEKAHLQGLDPLSSKTNYFIGTEEGMRRYVDINNYGRIKYRSVYPGVDLAFYGSQSQLEYDLLVAPKADVNKIRIAFKGAEKVTLTERGTLRLANASGDIEFHKPIAYQEIKGMRHNIEAAYIVNDKDQIGFKIGKYNAKYPLVIDPILKFSSYFWATPNSVSVDGSGYAYIVGSTVDTTLPATGTFQTSLKGNQDAYVVKVDTASAQVVYATYLGARRATTSGIGIAVDSAGNAYITGSTDSTSFPVTAGAYNTTAGGSFVTKLNADGNNLIYSTFFPDGNVKAIAINDAGNAYLAGVSSSLAPTAGAFQTSLRAAGIQSPFVAQLNSTGSGLVYATYVGGSGNDIANSIAVDGNGNAYLAGTAVSNDFPLAVPVQANLSGTQDAFVSKLNSTGTALIYSTYLGGSADEYGNAINVNAAGEAVIVGRTNSDDLQITPGVFQPAKAYPGTVVTNAFVIKMDTSGSLIYSSYLGGKWCLAPGVYNCFGGGSDGIDGATSVAIDLAGYAYVGGYTKSVSFPLVDAIHPTHFYSENHNIPFVSKITPNGDRLIYSLVLGSDGQYPNIHGVAVDSDGSAVVVGEAEDNTDGTLFFPITAGTFLSDSGYYVHGGILSKLSTGKYTVVLRPTGGTSVVGQNITFTADVLSLAAGDAVTFYDGSNSLGAVQVVNGRASITTTLPVGVHKITATFNGDGVTSPPLFQTVVNQ